jgi:hypothetical protein
MSLNCGLWGAYCSSPRWYVSMTNDGEKILTGENRRTRSKTCPIVTLSTTNPTWIDSGANPGLKCRTSTRLTNKLLDGCFGKTITEVKSYTERLLKQKQCHISHKWLILLNKVLSNMWSVCNSKLLFLFNFYYGSYVVFICNLLVLRSAKSCDHRSGKYWESSLQSKLVGCI